MYEKGGEMKTVAAFLAGVLVGLFIADYLMVRAVIFGEPEPVPIFRRVEPWPEDPAPWPEDPAAELRAQIDELRAQCDRLRAQGPWDASEVILPLEPSW